MVTMCRVLEVSRSGFYDFDSREESDRAKLNRNLFTSIESVYEEGRKAYGAVRITKVLKTQGETCSLNRVARLMRAEGLQARFKRPFRVQTTDSNHSHPIAPNLLNRNFITESPNQVWVSDITYIPTDEGWLYLATTMDLYSRSIVGWSMSASIKTQLVVDALEMALGRRQALPGLIHHSDRGSQYAANMFRKKLEEAGIVPSMSRKANCYDNAVAESFFGTLKAELVSHEHYRTHDEAKASIFDYIEAFYNRACIHSTLGYVSPAEFEAATV